MITVQQMLDRKGSVVWSVTPDATVLDALKLMAEKDIGAVLVLSAGKLTGILSERDYARKIILYGKASKDTPVREIMTEKVVCVGPGQSAEECMAIMDDKRIRHLPVIKDGQLGGVISIADVVQAIVSEQQFTIQQLEHYILGDSGAA